MQNALSAYAFVIDIAYAICIKRGMITGPELKAIRDLLQERQSQFGARFGVDQGTISRWETGKPPRCGAARLTVERVIAELREQVEKMRGAA